MCICINCRHLKKCKTYKFIQEQHESTNEENYTTLFYPSDNIISISINRYKINTLIDWDLKECSSFTEKPNSWTT
uniref:Ycf34 n=1 Tax=Leptosiphonia brodiei TaxID=2608611 RepID=A0A1Z1MAG0_9FLOR|nr:hypothetical protein [Leptosiphonia brodiei]ARW62872.1 hypothetical protein [Leptosiphonia brodiei]